MATLSVAKVGEVGKAYAGPTIDACLFHEWPSTTALADYLEPGWREVILRPGDKAGPLTMKAGWLYKDPKGYASEASYEGGAPPASDVDVVVRQAVEGREYAVLGYSEALRTTGVNHYVMARAVTRAANRWTIEQWLPRDDRLRALVLVTSAAPRTAAADIREFGRNPRMVGVAMGANGLGRAFGHSAYHEIYEAAAELNLPIVIQVGSDAISSLDSSPTAGGLPATYAEYASHAGHTLMAHVASLIMEGVFDRHPNLRVLCVGGGVAWLPAYSWRLDYWYRMNPHEVPWMTRLPSEYMHDHVRLSTGAMESPRNPGELTAMFASYPELGDMITFTSGYPLRDAEDVDTLSARIPADWHTRVFYDNAKALFSL